MKLQELARILNLQQLTPISKGTAPTSAEAYNPEITRAYASDLLSDVLANAPSGGILVTLQVHLNVIAVASHAGLRAVIFSCGRMPDTDVIEKGAEEGLSLFVSAADTFDIVGRLYELGLRGSAT